MPGMTITYALIQRVEKVAEAHENVFLSDTLPKNLHEGV